MPEKNLEIREVMRTVTDNNPVWMATVTLLDRELAVCADSVCQPDLNDSQRHFNAGRLAALKDFKAALEESRKSDGTILNTN